MSDADGTFESILIATDGSDQAKRALERAIAMAEPLEATVHVLAVVDTDRSPMTFDVETVGELEDAKERVVDEIVAAHDDHAVEVRGAVRRGRPAPEIVAYAEENAIDVIVVGRSGETGLAETLLGSTTDRVLRSASVPVVVVPTRNDETG